MRSRVLSFLALQAAVAIVLLLVLVLLVSGDLGAVGSALVARDFWAVAALAFVGVGVLQSLVLLPVSRRRARRSRGVPVWVSIAVVALLASLMTASFAWGVLDALRDFKRPYAHLPHAIALVALVAWGAWTIVFVAFVRRRPESTREQLLHALARTLLRGTAFEAVALIPLDLMVRRKTDCYCATGTCFAWAVCFAVGLIVLGPAMLLPVLIRRRADWYAERCDACASPAESARDGSGYRDPARSRCRGCGIAR